MADQILSQQQPSSSSSTPSNTSPATTIPSEFSSERYFKTQSPPQNLKEIIDQVRSFVDFHTQNFPDRRIVLITSGGTTVPLEHNVVRFLDNFSAGTRGSASAEAFLRTGKYAVIFLHRSHSLEPFSRHYPHSTNPFLDLLTIKKSKNKIIDPNQDNLNKALKPTSNDEPLFPILPTCSEHHSSSKTIITDKIKKLGPENSSSIKQEEEGKEDSISIAPQHHTSMISILQAHHLVHRLNLLHTISFVTVNEYLYLLRAIAQVLGEPSFGLGRRAMLYLAAAVSDFFIPQQKLSEHKIQSGKGSLVIEMDAVPKVLKDVTNEWSNQAFIISFKLETDSELLIPKAKSALNRYGHHLVIANELHTRKTKVLMIDREGNIEPIIKKEDPFGSGHQYEIEEEMVHRLVSKHLHWILQPSNTP